MSVCNPIDVFNYADTNDQPFDMDWAEWLVGAILVASTWVQSGDAGLVDFHDEDFTVDGSTVARVWVRGLEAGPGAGADVPHDRLRPPRAALRERREPGEGGPDRGRERAE